MKMRKAVVLTALAIFTLASADAQAQFTSRDKRWPTRGPWMWELSRELPKLNWEFNGIDFGHAHLGETLLKTQDDAEVERARVEVLDFIFTAPRVAPDEEQIAPTLVRTFWEVQRSFNWTHAFHRSIYDLFAADKVTDKEAAYHKILADYLSKPEAITFHTLDHHGRMWSWPESKTFRDKFRKFNSQIWAYHWLQGATYDVQLMGGSAKQRELMPRLIEHYHGYLRTPPEEWQMMPMLMETAPEFSMKFKEAAAIFDNLHMLHDNLDDVLCRPDLYPTYEARRKQILKILQIYLHHHHAGQDHYAEYHGSMEMMGMGAMQHGGDHGGGQGKQSAASGGHGQRHGQEKGGSAKPHEPLKDDIPPGKEHAAAGQAGKDAQKPAGTSEHGAHGSDASKKSQHAGMKDMGPRPPSAKDVLEGKTGSKTNAPNKEAKPHEHGGGATEKSKQPPAGGADHKHNSP